MTNKEYTDEAVRLLKLLISTPSASRSEDKAADIMEETIRGYGLEVHRLKNNVLNSPGIRSLISSMNVDLCFFKFLSQ